MTIAISIQLSINKTVVLQTDVSTVTRYCCYLQRRWLMTPIAGRPLLHPSREPTSAVDQGNLRSAVMMRRPLARQQRERRRPHEEAPQPPPIFRGEGSPTKHHTHTYTQTPDDQPAHMQHAHTYRHTCTHRHIHMYTKIQTLART